MSDTTQAREDLLFAAEKFKADRSVKNAHALEGAAWQLLAAMYGSTFDEVKVRDAG